MNIIRAAHYLGSPNNMTVGGIKPNSQHACGLCRLKWVQILVQP